MTEADALCVHLAILFSVLMMTTHSSRGAEKGEEGFRNFISRSGYKLMDGNREFRFVGANMPGLGLPYDYTLFLEERMTMPTEWELEDGFKTLAQMNAGVVRLWNLPIRAPGDRSAWQAVLAPGKFNEETFKSMDMMLAMANKHRIRVIFALTADYGDYLGGTETYAAYHKKKREAFYTDPEVKADYKKTLGYVLNRKNTVTGTLYKDDKAIMCWQFGNEFHHVPNPVEWETEMVNYIRQFDKNHLIMTGRDRGNCLSVVPDVIDICDRHYYGNDFANTAKADAAKLNGKRPLIIGEYGLTPDPKKVEALLQTVVDADGIAGALIWSLYFHDEDGGFKWHQIHTHPSITSYHWPGFPNAERHNERKILTILRAYAYKIQGKAVPPLPVPDTPELLTPADYPMLNWRGSVGASGYDIERADSADGPWKRIAENVSDADSVYRPLYCDATAAPGRKYCYRIAARNSSGVSEATRPVGPVRFKSAVLVDELKDKIIAESVSPDMVFDNDYNWRFAEYNYRARGKEGSWVLYRVRGRIEKVGLVFFAEGKWQDNVVVGVSADGKVFTTVKGSIAERQLMTLPGNKKPPIEMITFRADVAEKAGYVKLSWKSAAWLDRVEIFHDQTP